jgi:alpha-glucosidase
MSGPDPDPWWRSGVLYQIYPRSFADADGDGVGDLQGVIDHLDHLAWLGIDGIWLSPVTVSPDADWGYDVADYCDIDPDYGSLDTLDRLVAEAGRHGIRILLDLVPNHTSDQHPWFQDARSSTAAAHRDFYVWRDPRPDGSLPNNWLSTFGGPAWTLDEATGQYYLHNFLPEQPDLNWWNEEVRVAFDHILGFWWARGVAGFRIDVCNMVIKDKELRDNPPATDEDSFLEKMFGQRTLYNANRPEVHEVLRRWRSLADAAQPPRLLLGETNVEQLETLAAFYGSGTDELHLGFNFPFIEAPLSAAEMRAVVEETERVLPAGSWPVWTGSNHDVSRLATRWAGGDEAKVRAALLVLLTLRGTPVLFQGDEIGLPDGPIEREQVRDPVGARFWPAYKGRDPERTPMQWSAGPGGGFTAEGVTPWLPLGDVSSCNVAAQRADPASVLAFTRALVALRRATPDLQAGAYSTVPAPRGVWAYTRGEAVTVAVNLSDEPAAWAGPPGRIALSTTAASNGAATPGALALGPWEGVVVRAG